MDARSFLRQRLGGDRIASRGELEKLALYAAGQARISLDDARASTGDVSAMSIDAVCDAILAGKLDVLDTEYTKFIATKTPTFVLASALVRQLTALQPLREQVERDNKPVATLVGALRPPLFGPRKTQMETNLSVWTLAMIGRGLERLSQAILDSRRLSALEDEVFRHTFLALCAEARRNAGARR
jgi:DNA polymerase-3 subunit delta